ncbi:MAG: hypothetical protein LBU57_00460 [Dysgonamonadaceae bacterium]|jgi:hypothetical protein|nr:hypothetical protein [Dysgonamonadaceae bacterium]
MKPKYLFYSLLFCSICLFFLPGCESDVFPSGDNTGGAGGSMARFAVRDNYLYTVDFQNLKMFDISTSDQPRYLKGKEQHLGFDIETIFVKDTLLFIGSQSGMFIYSITRPNYPQMLSHVSHIQSCDPVVASGNYAYVTLNSENVRCGRTSNLLQVYDISNLYKPELKQSIVGFMHPRGLGVDGKKLFICDNGLKVYDIDNPENPRWVDDLSDLPEADGIDAYDVIPWNGVLLLTGANGLYQFDYTGEKLKFVSKIEVSQK